LERCKALIKSALGWQFPDTDENAERSFENKYLIFSKDFKNNFL
jgi:hypothetical protein